MRLKDMSKMDFFTNVITLVAYALCIFVGLVMTIEGIVGR